jgi:outer membrane protein OmpU
MKKTLYGTTAIVALGLAIVAATPASAQAPASGFSSTNFQFTVGGYARGFVGSVSNKLDNNPFGGAIFRGQAANATPNADTISIGNINNGGIDQQQDFRLDLTARANLPNGMAAGMTAQMMVPNSGPAQGGSPTGSAGDSFLRRQWVFLSTAFGQVELGSIDAVMTRMYAGPFDAFTAGGIASMGGGAISNFAYSPLKSGQSDTPIAGTQVRFWDRSANKIAYVSPRIEGFQLGLNYTPESSNFRESNFLTGAFYTAGGTAPANYGGYQQGFAAALNYTNSFSGIDVRAYGGYQSWQAPKIGALVGLKDPKVYGIGAGVRYMGFDLGASYANFKDGANPARGTFTNVGGFGTSLYSVDGTAWDVGVGYIFGPAAVSLTYVDAKNSAGSINNTTGVVTPQAFGDDKKRAVALSGRYTLGPGVNVEATAFWQRMTAGNGTNQTANPTTGGTVDAARVAKSQGVVTGLILTF